MIIFLLLIIASEAVTEIITSSELFDPLRKAWKKWTYPIDSPPPNTYFQRCKVFVDKLISCGYCASVWVAGFFAIWAPLFIDYIIINWLISIFVIHRLSNWLHVTYELIRKGRVRTYDLLVKIEMNDGEINGITGESESETEPEIE